MSISTTKSNQKTKPLARVPFATPLLMKCAPFGSHRVRQMAAQRLNPERARIEE